jgi:hypothetical protein
MPADLVGGASGDASKLWLERESLRKFLDAAKSSVKRFADPRRQDADLPFRLTQLRQSNGGWKSSHQLHRNRGTVATVPRRLLHGTREL